MTKFKRQKRIAELKSIITGIMQRGTVYKGKLSLHKESINRIKQCKSAIKLHESKL